MLFIALGAAIIVAAAAVGIAMAVGGGGDGGEEAEAVSPVYTQAGCTYVNRPSMGRQHVNELQSDFEYNTEPATSGPHFGVPAIWNAYDQPVEEIRLVHNLEHGGVIVQYGDDIPEEDVNAIIAWYRPDPNGIIVAPNPDLGSEVALTAWTQLLRCPGFDEAAFTKFREDYRFNGPEAFPPEALAPGM
jgi:hypothetical protein